MTTSDHHDLARSFDAELAKILTEGQVVIGDDGVPVRITPTAAMLNVVRQRLKDVGATRMAGEVSPLQQALQRAREQAGALRFQPADDDEEDIATA